MATYAKILKDASGNQILPYTRAKLVYTDGNDTVQNAIAIVQTIAIAKASASEFGRVLVGSNITVSNGVISSTKSNVTSALGYTPANINTVKYLYHGNCAVSSWKNTSTNGYSFYIDMPFSADNGGKTDLTSAKIMNPMSIKTGTESTDETIQKTLNIIADGFMKCTTDGILRIYTKKQPSSDITIYFEAQY